MSKTLVPSENTKFNLRNKYNEICNTTYSNKIKQKQCKEKRHSNQYL